MSMENAILELAAAIRYAADRNNGTGRALAAAPVEEEKETTSPARQAIQSALDAAKAGTKQQQDAELEQAVQKVEEENSRHAERDEKAQKEEAAEQEAEKQNAPADLDYAKDVRPVLLAAIKKSGKDAVAAMLATFGVDKADKLTAEQLPGALAEAQKLAA